MPWTSEHSKWLVDTGQRLHTADGKEVHIWEFRAKGISTLAESILTL